MERKFVSRFLLVLGCLMAVGCLTYQGFLNKRHTKYCDQLAICNPDIDCDIPFGLDTGYANDGCNFDHNAANDCLNGSWTCNTQPGFEFPIPPAACQAVCGNAATATGG